MGQAKTRGTFEERKAAAILREKEKQRREDIEADKGYDNLRPYRSRLTLMPYLVMAGFAGGLRLR